MDYNKPTEKQIDYVTSICEVLGIDLPDDETREAYSDFIDEHEKEFKQERYKQRYVYSQDTYRLEHSNVLEGGFCGDRKLNMNPQIEGMVSMDLKSEINLLIERLAFVENKELRKIILDGFVKKYGEIPDEYKDAVNAVVEM